METGSQAPDHQAFVDRYFQRKYYINKSRPGEDVCILSHSNKVCLVTLAPSHPVLQERKTVLKVDWKFGGVNRLSNRVSGKGKKGGQSLSPTSLLCEIKCEDGSSYQVACGVKSQLLEINDNLKTQPGLVSQKPQGEGYIAVVLPKKKEFEEEMKKLASEEDRDILPSSSSGAT